VAESIAAWGHANPSAVGNDPKVVSGWFKGKIDFALNKWINADLYD
jgi:hypothetical protein